MEISNDILFAADHLSWFTCSRWADAHLIAVREYHLSSQRYRDILNNADFASCHRASGKGMIMTTQKDTYPMGTTYEIRIKGYLDPKWSDWLEGLSIIPQDNGETLLSGSLPDQAALHGVLAKIRDLNLILVSVSQAGKV